MADVVIALQRPLSMGVSEMRAWVIGRASARQPALTLSVPEAPSSDRLLLRVELDDDAMGTAEDDFIDLMTDMRLLGLRPEVVTSDGWRPADQFAPSGISVSERR